MSASTRSSSKQAFALFVVEQMAGLGAVQAKAMFGGFGLYLHGLMFGLIVDDTLYFKVDEQSVSQFESAGLPPFRYVAKGRTLALRYHQAPAEVYDDAQAMVAWARVGYDCALRQQQRSAVKKKPKRAAETDLADLRNLGPKSCEMLHKAGISSVEDLRRVGAVGAYVRTRAIWPGASLNLLWALEGALSGRPWQEVAQVDRASLLMALEDAERHLPHRPMRRL